MQSILRTVGRRIRCSSTKFSTMMTNHSRRNCIPTIAVVFSGCGSMDGSDVFEATSIQIHIEELRAKCVCLALDENQKEVINGLTGDALPEVRNMLVETSRLTPYNVYPLNHLNSYIDKINGIVFCGGDGVIKNLTDFESAGSAMSIHPQVAAVVEKFRSSCKPMGFVCAAPIIAARLVPGVTITFGETEYAEKNPKTEKLMNVAKKLGANVAPKKTSEVCCDFKNQVYSVPSYLCQESNYGLIHDGIGNLIRIMLGTIKYGV